MGIINWFRIESAVQDYDFWLELRGARRKHRKSLRQELRANLKDAAADVGVTQALFNIGSAKQLAYAMTPEATKRPRWSMGLLWASVIFGLVLFATMFTAIAFLAGVEASGVVGDTVRGFVFPWFGVDFSARVEEGGRGFAAGADGVGWYVAGLPLLTFLLVSRPWRAFTQKAR